MALVLFCKHSAAIALLERELEYFKVQFEHERQRAEMAVDELLRTRVAAGPVTVPTLRETKEHESAVEKLLKDGEFLQAGEVE